MTTLEHRLIELGYVQCKLMNEYYEKRFKYTYIIISINSDSTIDYEWCGVQRRGLRKFQTFTQIKELLKVLQVMLKDLEDLRNYEKKD